MMGRETGLLGRLGKQAEKPRPIKPIIESSGDSVYLSSSFYDSMLNATLELRTSLEETLLLPFRQ